MRTALFALWLLFWSGPAYAATIALVRPSGSSAKLTETLYRLQGELLAVGLDVETAVRPPALTLDTRATDSWFERMATRNIDAIINVVGDSNPVGVEVWIYQKSSGHFRASRVMLAPNTPNAPETLAIRAIEVLRANFLVFDLDDGQPSEPRSVEPTARRPLDPVDQVEAESAGTPETIESAGIDVAAGAVVLTSLDGVGPALSPILRFDWTFHPGLAAEATLSGFGTRPTVETEAGAARVAQRYGLVGLRYSPPADSVLTGFTALSGGILQTSLEGWADAPGRGHRVDQLAFVVEGSVGTRLELSRRYHLSLAAHAQFATPYAAIHFVDEQVASTGRPNLLGSLTVGAWL